MKVAVAFTGRLTNDALIEPDPDAVQDAPDDATQVQVTPVRPAGIVSVTLAPVIGPGPKFFATIV